MTKINTLIFDFGGVLVNLNTTACEAAFEKLGFPSIMKWIDMYKQRGLFLEFEEGKIATNDFFEELKKLTIQDISVEDMKAAYLSFLGDIPQKKLDFLLDLRKQYQVLMLSNINAFIWKYARNHFFETNERLLSDYFDECYLSFEMGVCKPSPDIYQQIIASENLEPSHCLYLDDAQINIEAGSQVGFQTYLVSPEEDYIDKIKTILAKR